MKPTPGSPLEFVHRFWDRVDRNGPGGCWSWLGTNNGKEGRGQVHLGYRGDYRLRRRIKTYAYIVAWKLTNGEIEEGLCVCHKCDNPNCVNPKHLFLGTKKDNIMDMHKKGRADSFGFKKERSLGLHLNRRIGERLSDYLGHLT